MIPSTDRLIMVRLFRCFASWVQLQVVTLCQLANCATLGNVFATLTNHQVTVFANRISFSSKFIASFFALPFSCEQITIMSGAIVFKMHNKYWYLIKIK